MKNTTGKGLGEDFRHRAPLMMVLAALLLAGACRADIEILQPESGATVSGPIHLVARIPLDDVQGVHARVGDLPWVPMFHADDGTWRATLDGSLAPNGPSSVRLQKWPAGENTSAAVEVRIDNPLQHYWGNIHSHTSVSDGRMRPDEAYAYARDIAKLDFFSLTDHLEQVDPAEWRECLRAAALTNDDGSFVAFPGLEWTKGVGHMCVYEPAGHVWPEGLSEFYQFAPANAAVAKFNHPGWRDTTSEDFAYSAEGDSVIQLMEVRGDAEMRWMIAALDLGWHIAPDGSDDTHRERWGTSNLWTVVLAPGLSRTNVIDALRRRHCYSTRDRNCRLNFTLNGAVMGEKVEEPVTTATIDVRVADPDEGDSIKSVELYADGEVVQSLQAGATSARLTADLTPEPGEHYYFVKVTQADDDLLYSAPIWITVADE
ncbi:MAG: hypothetical protein GF393_07340 [Armatimonadia bacterium]|nr:hypothetical protein [Armatimonadia bacterium]